MTTSFADSIKFQNDGKLRIMHITDTHLSDDNIDASLFLLEEAIKLDKPHVAVITGDNVSNSDDPEKTKAYIDRLMSIFDNEDIAVAVTFGNHDSECGAMTRKQLMDHYNTHKCSLCSGDGYYDTDCGTYRVPVMSHDGSRLMFNLFVFDSNDYDDKGRYGCVLAHQVEWYKKVSDEVTAENKGEKVYSLAFQHMIVPEVYNALRKVKFRTLYSFAHMYEKNDYYTFDKNTVNFGTFNETPCCGYYNYGQFEAMAEKGDVLAVFSGHDHTNAFGVRYKGIDIVNSLSTRSQNDRFSSQYGYRMIEIDENDTAHYSCRVVRWFDMITPKNYKKYKDSKNFKTAKTVAISGTVQKCFMKLAQTATHILTGRKTTYSH